MTRVLLEDGNGNIYTLNNPLPVESTFADNGFIDSFGRLRISNPITLLDTQLQYDAQPTFWETVTVGGGQAIHNPNDSTVDLAVSTLSGDSVVRQTRQYLRYQSGKSQLILLTGKFASPQPNLRQRMGYFDPNNGVYFEYSAHQFSIGLRSSSSGVIVDTKILQKDWNIDKMDGTGPSEVILDNTRTQIFVIDVEWLGVGRVRVGFVFDGKIFYAHEFINSNVNPTTYMATANLPIRYEITNLGAIANDTSLKQICMTVTTEGGVQEELGIPFMVGNTSTISVTNSRPILSIRCKALFNGIVNRESIILQSALFYSQDQDAIFNIVYGGTLTNPSFSDVNLAHSGVEFDVAATAISGGITINGGIVSASSQGANKIGGMLEKGLLSKLPLSLNIAGAHPTTPLTDVVTLVAQSIPGTATDVLGQFSWREIR